MEIKELIRMGEFVEDTRKNVRVSAIPKISYNHHETLSKFFGNFGNLKEGMNLLYKISKISENDIEWVKK